MSGLRSFANAIRLLRDDLVSSRETVAVQVASNLLAQVENRIIQKGEGSEGVKLPGYSTKQVPKYFFYGKSRNAGADGRVRKSKKTTLSYQDFRQLNNLQTQHVDLYFTGEMWRGTGVTVTKSLFTQTQVTIQGRTKPAKDKIEWNSARYGGSILKPQKDEIEAARRAYQKDRINRIKRFLK